MSALDILKAIGGPGSVGFLAAACAVGLFLIYVWPKRRALGRAWLITVYAFYLILGWPVTAHWIAGFLPTRRPVPDLSQLAPIDALIVLGGDNAVGRIQETMRAWRALGPRIILVSGERWLLEHLATAGIPAARMRHDDVSSTTREQVIRVASFLHDDGSVRRAAVIASRLQMPRVHALTNAIGIEPILLPSPVDDEPPTSGAWMLVPSYAALRVSRDALYEVAALAYYRSRGWIDPEH